MNDVTLTGNLTRDPEVRFVETPSKKVAVTNFTLAVNEFFTRTNGEKVKETTFVPCEAWDSGAELIGKYLIKGSPVLLKGALREDKWEKDGEKHSRMKLRVRTFEFMSKNPKNDDDAPSADPIQESQEQF